MSLLLFIIIIMVSACSQGPKSAIKLNFALDYQITAAPNKVRVFPVHEGSAIADKIIDYVPNGSPISLPAGQWKFYTVEWNGALPYTGSVRCSASAMLDLQPGAEVNVDLTPTEATCGIPFFSTVFTPQDFYCFQAPSSTGTGTANLFRDGNGTAGNPFIICDIQQLNNIGLNFSNTPTIRSSHYRLAREINFYGGFDRIDKARRFVMIGASTATSSSASMTVDKFTGSFDGNNYSIKGMIINPATASLTNGTTYGGFGFIRHLADSGSVRNLNLVFSEIDLQKYENFSGSSSSTIANQVGFVAGIVSSTSTLTTPTISNVHIRYGHISANEFVGGLVGQVNSSGSIRIENSSLSTETEIRGRNIVGGLIGTATSGLCSSSAAIYRSFVDAKVHAEGSCSFSYIKDQPACTTNSGVWSGKAGGLIGNLTVASSCKNIILESFTKGSVEGQDAAGGLIASITTAPVGLEIRDSYSTSSILTHMNSSKAGGLIAGVNSGNYITINRAFHTEGAITGSGTGGIIPYFSPQPICSGVFFTSAANDFCSGSSWKTTNSIRNFSETFSSSWSTNISGSVTASSAWVMDDDVYDYPRLAWERPRLCHGLFSKQTGAGTADNPFVICSKAQFDAIPNHGNGTFFVLKNNIDLMANTGNTSSYFDTPLQINLNGEDHEILNMKLTPSIGPNIGLFKELQAGSNISNLKISNAIITSSAGNNVGTLAGINYGTIFNVRADGKIIANGTVGGIVGLNEGRIQYAESEVEVNGNNNVGGIVGNNSSNGFILFSKAYRQIFYEYSNPTNIGGLAGTNAGRIEESSSRSWISNYSASGTITAVGGLVGFNSGIINNSYTYGYFSGTASMTYNGIGGIAGQSTTASSLTNSYTGTSWGGLSGISALSNWGIFIGKGIPTTISGLYFVGGTAGNYYGPIQNVLPLTGGEIALPADVNNYASGWLISPVRNSHSDEENIEWLPQYENYPWYKSSTMSQPELRRDEFEHPDSFYYNLLGF